MRRRDFITGIAGSAVAWPLPARAQQPDRMQRIGVLMGYAESNVEGQAFVAAFREELLKLGWVEGRNLRSDYRWVPPGDAETTRRFAKELVALQPNLILAHNRPPLRRRWNRRTPSRSFLPSSPIRSAAASSQAFHAPGATPPVSPRWSRRWPAGAARPWLGGPLPAVPRCTAQHRWGRRLHRFERLTGVPTT